MRKTSWTVLVGLMGVFSAIAGTETIDGIKWSYALLGGGARITKIAMADGGTEFPTDVVIPASLGGRPVCEFGANFYAPVGASFYGKNICRVEIPNTVTNLLDGDIWGCFQGCYHLKTIVGGAGITRIGEAAFSGCSSLRGFELPAGLTYIGESAFQGCSSLFTSVRVPGGVKTVPEYAFDLDEDEPLDSFVFEEGVEVVHDRAFMSTTAKTISLPSTLKSFGMGWAYLFANRDRELTLHVASLAAWCGVTKVGGARYNPMCYATNVYVNGELLLNRLVIPEGPREIKANTFGIHTTTLASSAMSRIREVVLPDSLGHIGASGINLQNVTNIVFGANPIEFSEGAICLQNVNALTIPNTWAALGGIGLLGAPVHVRRFLDISPSNPHLTQDERGVYSENGTRLELAYSTSSDYTVREGVETIAAGAFCGMSVTNITIASTVTGMDGQAFARAAKIRRITLPTGLTSIPYGLLANCTSLESVIIPESVTNIGERAFYGCTALKHVTLPAGLTDIGGSAFYQCGRLREIAFPDALARIGTNAFANCTSLTEVVIPDSVVSIGSAAFLNDNSVTNLVLGAGLDPQDVSARSAFASLKNVSSVTLAGIGPWSGWLRGSTAVSRWTVDEGIQQSVWYGTNVNVEVCLRDGTKAFTTAFFAKASVYKSKVRTLVIPSTVTNVQVAALAQLVNLEKVVFDGCPPSVLTDAVLEHLRSSGIAFSYVEPSEPVGPDPDDPGQIAEKLSKYPSVKVLSSMVRKSDPTILDEMFSVSNSAETAEVRVLAFKDGVRSFANVLRPVSFADETGTNVGVVAANRTYALAWRIPFDWNVDLGRVTFEVLMLDQGVLPLRLVTLPRIGDHAGLRFSRNAISSEKALNALLWHYAGGEEDLTLTDGVLTSAGRTLATGATPTADGMGYLFGKLGYEILSGADLEHVNQMTRLGLVPSGARQYAVKHLEQ